MQKKMCKNIFICVQKYTLVDINIFCFHYHVFLFLILVNIMNILIIYIYLEPCFDPCFDSKRPCFGGVKAKNRGHSQVPGYTYGCFQK